MFLTDVVDQLLPRVQTLNLADPQTGFADREEIAFYVQQALRYLANRYQLQHFLDMNRALLTTSATIEHYTIPANYGFWYPEETYRSGMVISEADGTQVYNLTYYDPARFNLIFNRATTGKPVAFTLMGGLIHFFPIPDKVYQIQALERSSQEGATDVPEPYAEAIKVEALYRMAADKGRLSATLQDERTEILRTLVNGESRTRQRFYTTRERIGIGRYRRYGL